MHLPVNFDTRVELILLKLEVHVLPWEQFDSGIYKFVEQILLIFLSTDNKSESSEKVPDKICVEMTPKTNAAWSFVQELATNPRLRMLLKGDRKLSSVINYMSSKWKPHRVKLVSLIYLCPLTLFFFLKEFCFWIVMNLEMDENKLFVEGTVFIRFISIKQPFTSQVTKHTNCIRYM